MRKPKQIAPIDPKIQMRLDVLERLIDTEYDGLPSVFEAKTGIKMAQLNQWFSGYRALRDKALDRLQSKTSKPQGYFDGITEKGGAMQQKPRLEGKQDLAMALFNGYVSLVRVLHRKGSLNVADLANDIGDSIDFRRKEGLETEEQGVLLELLYQQVRQIEKHESDLAAVRAESEKKLQELRKRPDAQ